MQVTNGGTGISIYTYQNGVYLWLIPETFSISEFIEGLNSGSLDGQNSFGLDLLFAFRGFVYPSDIYQYRQSPQSYAAGYYQGFLEAYLVPDVGDAGTAAPIDEAIFLCQMLGFRLHMKASVKKNCPAYLKAH